MSESTVTGPDGKKYRVTHPEGATDAEKIAHVRAKVDAGKPVEYDYERSLEQAGPSALKYGQDMYEGVKSAANWVGEAAGGHFSDPAPSRALQGAVQLATGNEFEPREKFDLNDPATSDAAFPRWLEQQEQPRQLTEKAQLAQGIGEHYSDRYGGMDEIKTTAMEDPIGMLADMSGVATLGLSGAANTAKFAGVNTKVVKALEKARKVATALDPATLPTHALNVVPTELMYRKGLNVKGRDRADIKETAKYGLEQGITPSDAGLNQARLKMQQAAEQRTGMMEDMTDINIGEIYQHVEALRGKRGSIRGSVAPSTDSKVIKQTAIDHAGELIKEYPTVIPAQHVNDIKTSLYNAADDAYGDAVPRAQMDTYKAIGRGAKDSLESRNPKIREVNEEMGMLGNLIDTLDPSAIHSNEIKSIGVDLATRRVTDSDAAGIAMNIVGQRAAATAVLVKQLRENPTVYAAARLALLQAGRTEQEADAELRKLIDSSK